MYMYYIFDDNKSIHPCITCSPISLYYIYMYIYMYISIPLTVCIGYLQLWYSTNFRDFMPEVGWNSTMHMYTMYNKILIGYNLSSSGLVLSTLLSSRRQGFGRERVRHGNVCMCTPPSSLTHHFSSGTGSAREHV